MGWLAGGETWTEAALEKDRRTWTQAEDALSILPNLLIGKKGHRKDVFCTQLSVAHYRLVQQRLATGSFLIYNQFPQGPFGVYFRGPSELHNVVYTDLSDAFLGERKKCFNHSNCIFIC